MKLLNKNTFLTISIICNVVLAIAFAAFVAHTKNGEGRMLPHEDNDLYLQRIVQANYSLLQNDYEHALKVYGEVESQALNDLQWVELASNFIKKQNRYKYRMDSLSNVLSGYYRYKAENESVLDSLLSKAESGDFLIDSLSKTLQEQGGEINRLLSSKQGLEGEIEALKNATGKLNFVNKDRQHVKYYGELKDGKAHGYGIAFFESKGVYEGYWQENFRHGEGKYIWANGDVYEGNFVQGKREGHGVYTFASKEKYVGEWENDVRDGHGVVYEKNGSVLLDGSWQEDHFVRKSKEHKK